MDRPLIFNYGNYRSFLDDFIRFLRETGEYSNRKFAKNVGFKSHTYINLVLKGKRDLTQSTKSKVAKELGLRADEAQFFKLLVDFNQTLEPEERDERFAELRNWVRKKLVKVAMLDQFDLYSNWKIIALLESLSSEFSAIASSHLRSELEMSPSELKEGISVLERLKLIEIKGSEIRRTENQVTTENEVQSLLVRNFHREMTELALKKLSSLEKTEREFNSVTLPLTQLQFDELRAKVREFSDEIQRTYLVEASPKAVYHLNLQLFPILSLDSIPRVK